MNRQQQWPSPFPHSTRAAAPSMFVSTRPPPPPTSTTTTTTAAAAKTNDVGTNNNNKPARISMNDVSIPTPGIDSTSSLSWSPPNNNNNNNNNNNLLVSSNWDSGVRCWKVEKNQQQQQQGAGGGAMVVVQAIPQAMVNHENAVLDTCFSPDGTVVFSVGCDKAVRMWDLGAKLPTASSNNKIIAPQIGAHDAPIGSVRFLKAHGGMVVSAGWDNKVKFWDGRCNEPVACLTLSDRIHAMDVNDNLLVAATADQKIVAYDCSSNEPRPLPTKNPLQNDQVRTVVCFPDSTGYAIGGATGRVALEYLQDVPRDASLIRFTFSAHRDMVEPNTCTAHAVNSISFYDTHKLATTGSDGKIAFWDKQTSKKLRTFEAIQRPIPCAMFNADSSLLAYASTYDWSKGCMHAEPGNRVFLHSMTL